MILKKHLRKERIRVLVMLLCETEEQHFFYHNSKAQSACNHREKDTLIIFPSRLTVTRVINRSSIFPTFVSFE